jgi:hypothetical protein
MESFTCPGIDLRYNTRIVAFKYHPEDLANEIKWLAKVTSSEHRPDTLTTRQPLSFIDK